MHQKFKTYEHAALTIIIPAKSRFGLILISALCYATLMTIAPLLLGQGLDNLITLLQQGGWQPSEFLQVIKWPLLLLGISWLMISLFSFYKNTQWQVSAKH